MVKGDLKQREERDSTHENHHFTSLFSKTSGYNVFTRIPLAVNIMQQVYTYTQ